LKPGIAETYRAAHSNI